MRNVQNTLTNFARIVVLQLKYPNSFYHSDSPNSWFLDLDITDDHKSVVASYTDGLVQVLDISSNVGLIIMIFWAKPFTNFECK